MWRSGGIAPPFLTSALDGQFHGPAVLPLCNEPPDHWIGGWVSPRHRLDAVEERKNIALQGIEPGISSPSIHQVRFFFFNLYSGGWNQGPLDTAAT
jgi:anti-sigma factor ChrR (cupin superfamily)